MQGPDQKETAAATKQAQAEDIAAEETTITTRETQPVTTSASRRRGGDWLAIGIVALVAAIFALITRLGPQPSAALTPVAVLSATGCGLFVTAIRKLRTMQRPGLFEAAIGGFCLALFQFLAALSYPNIIAILGADAGERAGFLTTWALVGGFTIVFSIVGATLGHLAFAPLRPLPARPDTTEETSPEHDEDETVTTETEHDEANQVTETVGQEADAMESVAEDDAVSDDTRDEIASDEVVPSRTFVSYLVVIVLLGLAPTVAGYVFSAAYDVMLSAYQFAPGPFPTLRLLSAALPWQIPIPIDLSGNNAGLLIFLLWRIPLFLGNPSMFDVQALEPLVFNGAALAILLLTMHNRNTLHPEQHTLPGWRNYLWLTAIFGLLLILAPDLWLLRGLEGLLQIPQLDFALPLRTLHLLDPLTFTLNLLTGPAICLIIALLLRRQYTKTV